MSEYRVCYIVEDDKRYLHVYKEDLEAVCRVLIYNDISHFEITRDENEVTTELPRIVN